MITFTVKKNLRVKITQIKKMNFNQPFSYFHYDDYWGLRRKNQVFQPITRYYENFGYHANYYPATVIKQRFRPPPGVYFLFPKEQYYQPEIVSPCSAVSETSSFFDFSDCDQCDLESPVTSQVRSRPSSPTKKYKKKKFQCK